MTSTTARNSFGNSANRLHAGLALAAGLAIGALAGNTAFELVSPANAAIAPPPLTIKLKSQRTLSTTPGIRLVKTASGDGTVCYRASRRLEAGRTTVRETFCRH